MGEATVRATITKVAEAEGLNPKVLLAMAFKESTFRPHAVGAAGEIGVFQIRCEMHKVRPEDARDVAWATRWTCRRIKSWRRGIWYGVYRHNGAGPDARVYVAEIKRIVGDMI